MDGLAKNLSRMSQAAGGGAGGDFNLPDETVLPVEAEHPEFFHGEPGDQRTEMVVDKLRAVEHGVGLGGRAEHPPGDFHDGDQLECLDAPNALDFAKVCLAPTGETGERACLGDQLLAHADDAQAFLSAAEQHGQQLAVAQGAGAVLLKAFLRALAGGKVLDARSRVVRGAHRAGCLCPLARELRT